MSSGPKNLTDAELLAVIIRSGSRNESALALSQRLMAREDNGMSVLNQCSIEELMANPGIGPVKAAQIKAALEFGCRTRQKISNSRRPLIRTPQEAITMLEGDMSNLPREELRTILLDVRNRVIRISRISEGSLTSAIIQPRDLFREAVKANAAALILAHNHPSGDASPSKEDIETTHRLIEAGKMMEIRVVDHLIIASGGSLSMRQAGLI